MDTWIWASIAAAFLQTLRFMLQKVLSTTKLSAAGATFSRFAYSAPFIWVLVVVYFSVTQTPIPAVRPDFWITAPIGGITQILATICVVAIFKSRNFAVGITFKKTEVIQIAFASAIFLGEAVSAPALFAIMIGLIGVVLVSYQTGDAGPIWQKFTNRAAGLGVLSGFFFALSGVSYRAASLAIETDQAFIRAALTLLVVVTWQTISMWIWLVWRDPSELKAVWGARKTAIWVGITSMGGSYMWFTAFTLQNAAYVNAVGQVELIFSIMATTLFFHEKITWREIAGIGFITSSVIGLILVA